MTTPWTRPRSRRPSPRRRRRSCRCTSTGTRRRYAFPKREPLLVEHENFRDAVLGTGGTVVTFAQGVHTIEVASAVLESSKGHGEIEIGAQPQAVIS